MKIFLCTILLFSGFALALPAQAQSGRRFPANVPPANNSSDVNAAVNNAIQAANNATGAAANGKPIDKFNQPVTSDLGSLINRTITILFSLIATVSVIFIIIGGFRLVVSRGDQTAVKTAKATIAWAVGGLIVALLAFTVIRLVTGVLF